MMQKKSVSFLQSLSHNLTSVMQANPASTITSYFVYFFFYFLDLCFRFIKGNLWWLSC